MQTKTEKAHGEKKKDPQSGKHYIERSAELAVVDSSTHDIRKMIAENLLAGFKLISVTCNVGTFHAWMVREGGREEVKAPSPAEAPKPGSPPAAPGGVKDASVSSGAQAGPPFNHGP